MQSVAHPMQDLAMKGGLTFLLSLSPSSTFLSRVVFSGLSGFWQHVLAALTLLCRSCRTWEALWPHPRHQRRFYVLAGEVCKLC